MQKNSKSKPKIKLLPSENIRGIALSSITSIFIHIILSLVISLFLLKSESISENYIMYFYFCGILSSFAGGFISSKMCNFKGIICGLINFCTYSAILTVIMLFTCNGSVRPDILILYAVILLFSVLGGIAGANTKRRK